MDIILGFGRQVDLLVGPIARRLVGDLPPDLFLTLAVVDLQILIVSDFVLDHPFLDCWTLVPTGCVHLVAS